MSERRQTQRSAILKPAPTPSPESRPFWLAARASRLSLQRCVACGRFRFPPACICPHCFSDEFAWEDVSGKGTIHAFTVVHRANQREFMAEPYVVAVIELDEGPRLVSNVITEAIDALRCGLPVKVDFELVDFDMKVPRFKLMGAAVSTRR